MVGLPCSGKTTWARQLAEQHHAVRLTPDEWHVDLFGQDADDPQHDERHSTIERLMWQVAQQLLARDIDVVLDFGFWSAAEWQDFRERAAALAATTSVHYAAATAEELLDRLAKRNADLPPGAFAIRPEALRYWMTLFEPPTAEELAH